MAPGDDIAELIIDALSRMGVDIEDGDIVVVAHAIVSKSEGRIVHRSSVHVTSRAAHIAKSNGWDPVHVELAFRESQQVLRTERALVTVTHGGLVCNFGGVDASNAPPDSFLLLPLDSDASAEHLRERIYELTGRTVAVIIADTQGRPWRRGSVNLAIGLAGIDPFRVNRGKSDLYGRTLQRSLVCQADEIAAAAEPVMGQADEGTPVAVVRGYVYRNSEDGRATAIIRPEHEDVFR